MQEFNSPARKSRQHFCTAASLSSTGHKQAQLTERTAAVNCINNIVIKIIIIIIIIIYASAPFLQPACNAFKRMPSLPALPFARPLQSVTWQHTHTHIHGLHIYACVIKNPCYAKLSLSLFWLFAVIMLHISWRLQIARRKLRFHCN